MKKCIINLGRFGITAIFFIGLQATATDQESYCSEPAVKLMDHDKQEIESAFSCNGDTSSCEIPHLKLLGRLFRGSLKGEIKTHVEDLLLKILNQYKANIESNLNFMHSLQACFDMPLNQRTEMCRKSIAQSYVGLSDALIQGRMHLSQIIPTIYYTSQTIPPTSPPNPYLMEGPQVFSPQPTKHFNSIKQNGDFHDRDLWSKEWQKGMAAINVEVDREVNEVLANERREHINRSTPKEILFQKLQFRKALQLSRHHWMTMTKEMYERTPILMYLPHPHAEVTEIGGLGLGWSDSEIFTAIGKVIENAEKEKTRIEADINRKELVFRRWDGESAFRHFVKGQRMWMEYIGFDPVVKMVISKPENHAYCQLADGIRRLYHERHVQNEASLGILFTATGAVAGLAAADLEAAGMLDVTQAAAAALRIANIASITYGAIVFSANFAEYSKTRGQILSLTGLGGDQEFPIADLAALQERQMEILLSGGIAIHGMVKTGLTAYTVAKACMFGPQFVRHSFSALETLLAAQANGPADAFIKATVISAATAEGVKFTDRQRENLMQMLRSK